MQPYRLCLIESHFQAVDLVGMPGPTALIPKIFYEMIFKYGSVRNRDADSRAVASYVFAYRPLVLKGS